MSRFHVIPLGSTAHIPAPFIAETGKAASASTLTAHDGQTLLRVAGETEADGRTVTRLDVLDCASGERFALLAVLDRVPHESVRGAYGRETRPTPDKANDHGGRAPSKGRSRWTETFQNGGVAPEGTVMPSGGAFCSASDRKAAILDLAGAGLGTLNGEPVTTAVSREGRRPDGTRPAPVPAAIMRKPEAGSVYRADPLSRGACGRDPVAADAPIPAAILAARVTPRSDSDPRERRAAGGESAKRYGTTAKRRHSVARRRLA